MSFTETDRQNLKKAAFEFFIKPQHLEFVDDVLAVSSPVDLWQMYLKFQSVPQPYEDFGFKTALWNIQGSTSTLGFGKNYDQKYHKSDRAHKVTLNLPYNVAELVGSGYLRVDLEVDTRKEEGWEEWVEFLYGDQFTMNYETKSWVEAEDFCRSR